jgi:hypothetical protein
MPYYSHRTFDAAGYEIKVFMSITFTLLCINYRSVKCALASCYFTSVGNWVNWVSWTSVHWVTDFANMKVSFYCLEIQKFRSKFCWYLKRCSSHIQLLENVLRRCSQLPASQSRRCNAWHLKTSKYNRLFTVWCVCVVFRPRVTENV